MESISHEPYVQPTVAQGSSHAPTTAANGNGHAGNEETTTAEKTTMAHKVRKRTKTGCLTCRKRRIKCGEERPTCKNCTKSKRECEGYVPRVVFKDPVNALRQSLDVLQEQQLYGQLDPNGAGFGHLTSMSVEGVPLAPLAPRPPYEEYGLPQPSRMGDPYAQLGQDGYMSSGINNQLNLSMFGMPTSQASQASTKIDHGSNVNAPDRRHSVAGPTAVSPHHAWPAQLNESSIASSHTVPSTTWMPNEMTPTAQATPYPTPLTARSSEAGSFPTFDWPKPDLNYSSKMVPPSGAVPSDQKRHSISGDAAKHYIGYQVQFQNALYGLPSTAPLPANLHDTEDDPFDVESEEENIEMDQVGDMQSSDLGLMLQMSACQSDADVRSTTTASSNPRNILAKYRPAYIATPLMDADTARVFCHFITATGPTLNVCERHPANPAIIFSGRPVPLAQRALWSYTMPMLALKHQGLLHSMLALSSLHIAKLQHASPTPSLKHYHYALRRVAKALGNPVKRRDVATLAATLLLGFYEVTTAEHNKWNSHLSGARELIAEIDFAGMARRIEAQRDRQEEEELGGRSYVFNGHTNFFSKPLYYETPTQAARRVDDNLISILTGHNSAHSDTKPIPATDEPPTPSEVETFQTQSDLFWWYAKQDVYQSILSNNRLLLSYDRWGECPPRSPIGRQDAAYGTMDHLLLLMARLADFAAKDLPRKRRAGIAAAKAQSQAESDSNHTSQGPSPTQKKVQSPPFYGMMPDPGPVRLPSGFDQTQHDRIFSVPAPSEKMELSTATAEAEAEHAAITAAFDAWAEALGPSFAPLSSEHMTPMATPFGPAIYYRSYPIACIQALFHCGHIIRIRTAPSMPAAAMAAAGVAAQATAHHANIIGRICAGIQPVSNTAPLNPHHGSALMEICMSLFHAGVQYRDPAQRGWTITKLRDVSRLTGWQTSALIASGCERAWIRAAQMGRGPPYERTMNSSAKDDRVAGRSRDPRFLAHPPRNNNDRRFVRQNAGTRVYWAMGILSVEEDMAEMSLNEGELG